MTTKLEITLKSNLCVGSGFSYAGIIDGDISYDKYGYPYISGKRLKGCIRESADLLNYSQSLKEEIFGKRADSIYSGNTGITISDAYPVNRVKDTDLLDDIFESEKYGKYFKQENVLGLYTSVKAQTKIGSQGVAEDNTLRFTRVINQYSFDDSKELVFEAVITYPDKYKEDIQDLVKATRNIGMDRNRGLGSVVMKMAGEECASVMSEFVNPVDLSSDKSDKVKISYLIKNTAPVVISSENDERSIDYINGGSVMGAFANAYLKDGHNPNERAFKELFLSNNSVFSDVNLAKVDGDEYSVYYTAPDYVRRLKKTGKLVDSMALFDANLNEDKEYDYRDGNQPKKLNSYKISKSEEGYSLSRVSKEVIYHHTKKDEEKLFFFEAIEPNQYFAGDIVVANEYKEIIVGILQKNKLSLGKSRSSQYGTCEVQKIVIEDYKTKSYKINAGDIVRLNLLSDTVLIDNNGNYVTRFEDAWNIIKNEIHADDTDPKKSSVNNKIISGYSGIWNIHKPEIPVFTAGSVFSFVATENMMWPEYLGVKNNEGFGNYQVSVYSNEYKLKEKNALNSAADDKCLKVIKEDIILSKIFETILINEINKSIKAKYVNGSIGNINITSASLGRLSLMARESYNEAMGVSGSYEKAEKAYINLVERVGSIKSASTQRECEDFLRNILGKFKCVSDDKPQPPEYGVIASHLSKGIDGYSDLVELLGQAEADKTVFAMWNDIVLVVLVDQKYAKKGADKNDD